MKKEEIRNYNHVSPSKITHTQINIHIYIHNQHERWKAYVKGKDFTDYNEILPVFEEISSLMCACDGFWSIALPMFRLLMLLLAISLLAFVAHSSLFPLSSDYCRSTEILT